MLRMETESISRADHRCSAEGALGRRWPTWKKGQEHSGCRPHASKSTDPEWIQCPWDPHLWQEREEDHSSIPPLLTSPMGAPEKTWPSKEPGGRHTGLSPFLIWGCSGVPGEWPGLASEAGPKETRTQGTHNAFSAQQPGSSLGASAATRRPCREMSPQCISQAELPKMLHPTPG